MGLVADLQAKVNEKEKEIENAVIPPIVTIVEAETVEDGEEQCYYVFNVPYHFLRKDSSWLKPDLDGKYRAISDEDREILAFEHSRGHIFTEAQHIQRIDEMNATALEDMAGNPEE